MKTIILLMAMIGAGIADENDPATREAKVIYSRFLSCSEEANNCRNLTSELISNVYDINSLKTASGFMTNSELAQHIETSKDWKNLGPAYKEDVLESAQQKANDKNAVVAVYTNQADQLMHVAVILPGQMKPSGTWGMPVPNAVSLALYDSDHSFVNKGLSYAFKKHMLLRVKIYAYE